MIGPSEISLEQPSSPTHLLIKESDFKQIIQSYKLEYDLKNKVSSTHDFQSQFNREFGIDDKPQADDKDFKIFLRTRINKAFKKPELIQQYFEAIDRAQESDSLGRGIHGGNHVANVTLYAKMLLNLYKKYKEHLPENLQKEVTEFDEKKEKDLEILTLMHDCARTNQRHDQDEYKNAFYVALIMKKLEDPRFAGDEISQEGLDLITNLSLKESEDKDKSLTSKLIQSADSLAITRVSKIIFYNDYVDAIHDFHKIQDQEEKIKILNELNKMSHLISDYEFFSRIEEDKGVLKKLEFIDNSLEVFNQRITEEKILESFELAREDLSDLIPQDFEKIKQESYFVHVVNSSRFRGSVIDRLNSNRFLNFTLIFAPNAECKDAFMGHFADVQWYQEYFLIFNQEPNDGIIFLTGFKRDVDSDKLSKFQISSQNDFDKIKQFPSVASKENIRIFSPGIDTQEEFERKIHEIMFRRTYPEEDISDQPYQVSSQSDFRVERIGKDRYNGADFKQYQNAKIANPRLTHNECHGYGAIHNVLHVGLTKDFLQNEKIDKAKDFFDLKKVVTLQNAKKSAQEINDERKRLMELDEPMEDESFKFCVNHEFKRITTCFEKIVFLREMREDIRQNPDNIFLKSSFFRKIFKETEFEDGKFLDTEENRRIWIYKNINKTERTLVKLMIELKSYEQQDSFAINGLVEFVDSLDYKDKKDSQQKIDSWIGEIMEGKTEQKAVEKVVEKIKIKLRDEVKVVAQDMRNPTNLIVIGENYLESEDDIKKIKDKIESGKAKLRVSTVEVVTEVKFDLDLSMMLDVLNGKSRYDLIYKLYPNEDDRNALFAKVKIIEGESPKNFNDLVLKKIIENRDINSLLYLLNSDFIKLEDYRGVPLIHVLEGCSNVDKIKELIEIGKNKTLEIDINQKDKNGLTILDKMLPKCTAKSLKELLDLGAKTLSAEAIDAILKSKKESVKKVIFENDELRNKLSIKSLKLDANYKAFFEKLANGDEEIIDQVKQAFENYALHKNVSYKFELEGKEIILNASKIIEFLEQKNPNDQVSCPIFISSSTRGESIYQSLEKKLSEEIKQTFKASFEKAKNSSQQTDGVRLEGARADVVFVPPPQQNSMQ